MAYYAYNIQTGKIFAFSKNNAWDDDADTDVIQTSDIVPNYAQKVVNGVLQADAEAASTIAESEAKGKRNDLLAETDWWANSDRTMTQAQIDYRQALRDVPQQDGFPTDITWPTKPE